MHVSNSNPLKGVCYCKQVRSHCTGLAVMEATWAQGQHRRGSSVWCGGPMASEEGALSGWSVP